MRVMKSEQANRTRKLNTALELQYARAWRERMTPHFDAIDAGGGYLDSALRWPHLRVRTASPLGRIER